MMNTEKKNQHYLPKFYLRNFSFQRNLKQIGIFNPITKFFYPSAKIKTQVSKNFFYGHDGVIEDSLANLEGSLSTIVKQIICDKVLPRKNSSEHIDLIAFVALTDLRNPVGIRNMRESRNQIKERLLELHPKTDAEKLVPDMDHQEAIEIALSVLPRVLENMTDLDYKLLINKTSIPFITSDFPIVKYNQFLEERKWDRGKTGYGCTGLQIFVSLNPEILLLLYDSNIYKVGHRKNNYHDISNIQDVDQLNIMQLLNCFEHVFFNESIEEQYLLNLANKSNRFKRANTPKSGIHDILNPDKEWSKMLSIGSTDLEISLKITGINRNSRAGGIKLNPTLAQLRPKPLENMKKVAN